MQSLADNTFRLVVQINLSLRDSTANRQETLTIRNANRSDIPALSLLHEKAWAATYPHIMTPPTAATRAHQWTEQFQSTAKDWFCFVVETPGGDLIGFTKGKHFNHKDLPGFTGELNKIYLLQPWQRLGLGSRLVGLVAQRFLSEDIHSMLLFADPQNPNCAFYERLGGEKLYDQQGVFHGAYGWSSLEQLSPLAAEKSFPTNP